MSYPTKRDVGYVADRREYLSDGRRNPTSGGWMIVWHTSRGYEEGGVYGTRREAEDVLADAWREAIKGEERRRRIAAAARSVRQSVDIDSLLENLRAFEHVCPSEDRDHYLDYTDLPTFGGQEPRDTTHVWSWNETSLLRGTCVDDMTIELREGR